MNDFSPIRGPVQRVAKIFGVPLSARTKAEMKYTVLCKCGCLLYDGTKPYTGGKIGCPKCKGITGPR